LLDAMSMVYLETLKYTLKRCSIWWQEPGEDNKDFDTKCF
jgi:hypothetical protein